MVDANYTSMKKKNPEFWTFMLTSDSDSNISELLEL